MKTWAEQKQAEKGLTHEAKMALRLAWGKHVLEATENANVAAQAVGMNSGNFNRMMNALGVPLEKARSGGKVMIPLASLKRLAAKGMTAAEIADALRCSRSRVHMKAKENGITLTHGVNGRYRVPADTSAKPAPDAPKPSAPKPGTMAWYAARENKAMRMVGRR